MREDFLHYIWKFKKFDFGNSRTSDGLALTILDCGTANVNSGPDFFNSSIIIGEQTWAGNTEIHIKSSDWYLHGHETDPNYDNVILHVVWEDDAEIFRRDNTTIPTLELRDLVSAEVLENYRKLFLEPRNKWINCEKDFSGFTDFELENWLERVYFERLEAKSLMIKKLLKRSENNWEAVLFWLLAKNFGLNVNADAFLNMAQSFDFGLVRKLRNSPLQLEALFFGQALLLEEEIQSTYHSRLQKEYEFLKRKFSLEPCYQVRPKFFRLRPDNFPTIRISQLAALYHGQAQLFSEIINANNLERVYELFQVAVSPYWQKHYSFNKSHSPKKKALTKDFIHLLVINTLVPLKFCYAGETGTGDVAEIINLLEIIGKEKNSIIGKFNKLRPNTAVNALQSQALLQLKKEFCDKNACLKCGLGTKLIRGNL